ncbi:DUF2489 domain-containing protein [Marinomonas sp.]
MSLTVFFIFLAIAIAIMAVSTGFILRQLKRNKERARRIQEGEARMQEERQKRIDSIRVLLKTVGSEELNWIETSIRIKNLLDQLGVDLSAHENISAFYIIEEKTQHIPTHDQWKSLPITARAKFLKEMDAYEEEYRPQLLRAKDALAEYSFH